MIRCQVLISFPSKKKKNNKHYLSQKHPNILGKSEKVINLSLDSVISIGYIRFSDAQTLTYFLYIYN